MIGAERDPRPEKRRGIGLPRWNGRRHRHHVGLVVRKWVARTEIGCVADGRGPSSGTVGGVDRVPNWFPFEDLGRRSSEKGQVGLFISQSAAGMGKIPKWRSEIRSDRHRIRQMLRFRDVAQPRSRSIEFPPDFCWPANSLPRWRIDGGKRDGPGRRVIKAMGFIYNGRSEGFVPRFAMAPPFPAGELAPKVRRVPDVAPKAANGSRAAGSGVGKSKPSRATCRRSRPLCDLVSRNDPNAYRTQPNRFVSSPTRA